MTTQDVLVERSNGTCELCTSASGLSIYEIQPTFGPSEDSSILVCEVCRSQIDNVVPMEPKHWFCLTESMWSEFLPVKVMAYRMLKKLGPDPWAQDLLSQFYFEEETQKWADADIQPAEEAGSQTIDSNGTPLSAGDTVTLIKDLNVKGANFTAKRGTTVKNISLTDDPKLVEGRVNGIRIVLVADYLKKA